MDKQVPLLTAMDARIAHEIINHACLLNEHGIKDRARINPMLWAIASGDAVVVPKGMLETVEKEIERLRREADAWNQDGMGAFLNARADRLQRALNGDTK